MIEATVFTNFRFCQGNKPLTAIADEILNGKYETTIKLHRAALHAGDPATAERIKKSLEAFTVSATYRKTRKEPDMIGYNSLLILDIDKLAPEAIPRLRSLINEAPYTIYSFLSPGGQGLKIIACSAVDIEQLPQNHRIIYNTVKAWYEELLGVEIDASGSDAGRLCFVSYDPLLYASPRFSDWLHTGKGMPKDLPLLKPLLQKTGKTTNPRHVAKQLSNARNRLDKQEKYQDGNRNNYVYHYACLCNRIGVPEEVLTGYCTENFGDLLAEERSSAITSAYSHREEHDTFPLIKNGKKVELIRDHLSTHFFLRKNVVRNLVEYRDKRAKSHTYHPVTDYWENTVWCNLQLEGVNCKITELRSVIHSGFSKEFDPFKFYFSKLPSWDGETDYIARLASTVSTTRPEYWLTCLRKWLVATVACAIDEKTENHAVLLLSGGQGLGKTTWCRNLVPPELHQYVYSGNLDPASKDASLLLSDCFLILLDELSGQSRMELNRLKAMITKNSVHERRAYAHNSETYERRASFAATVNDSQVLTDRTGSRRFLCFETVRIDYLTPVDYSHIYSQALALYKGGFKYWFSDTDIAEINDNNEPFLQSSPEEELFYTFFRKPCRFEAYLQLSSSEIIAKIAEKTRMPITQINVVNLGKMLKRTGFEHFIRNGKRFFNVIELTFDEVKAVQLGIRSYDNVDAQAVDNKGVVPNDKTDEGNEKPQIQLPF